MPIYGRGSVYHVWLLDPLQRTLEVFRRQDDAWLLVMTYIETKKVRAEPFDAVEIDLGQIWGETVAAEDEEVADEAAD